VDQDVEVSTSRQRIANRLSRTRLIGSVRDNVRAQTSSHKDLRDLFSRSDCAIREDDFSTCFRKTGGDCTPDAGSNTRN
jgi:hypothetical protein